MRSRGSKKLKLRQRLKPQPRQRKKSLLLPKELPLIRSQRRRLKLIVYRKRRKRQKL